MAGHNDAHGHYDEVRCGGRTQGDASMQPIAYRDRLERVNPIGQRKMGNIHFWPQVEGSAKKAIASRPRETFPIGKRASESSKIGVRISLLSIQLRGRSIRSSRSMLYPLAQSCVFLYTPPPGLVTRTPPGPIVSLPSRD